MNNEITEVLNHYTDDDNYIHIDAYFSEDDEVPGQTVAIVCKDTRKVYFINNQFRNHPLVTEAIDEVLKKDEATELLEDDLIDNVIGHIKKDIEDGDVSAIFGLLALTPVKHLIEYLPEEQWEVYESLR